MKYKTLNFIIVALLGLMLLFFSNNFGLVDIERTAIITAIGIDLADNGEYELTAQIAVPEASDTNTENNKSQIFATAGTAGAALKKIANITGWFPNLSYCHLILLGESFNGTNVIKILDYFLTTFRLQDSALVAMADGNAKEMLTISTPLDTISSFAIQKIIIKSIDFQNNVATSDIKNFCAGYYSKNQSSYMPIISVFDSQESNGVDNGNSSATDNSGGSQGASSGEGGVANNKSSSDSGAGGGDSQKLFYADKTALFKKGVKVGELNSDQSFILNNFKENMKGATFELKKVTSDNVNFNNFLLTIFDNQQSIEINADQNNLSYDITLKVFCKISDQNTGNAPSNLSSIVPMPNFIVNKAKEFIEKNLQEVIQTSIQTECDFFNLLDYLYQYKYGEYFRYKENYLSVMKINLNVEILNQV